MEINFISISGDSLKLTVESSSIPATIYPIICKSLNLPLFPLLFYKNGKMIPSTSKFSELGLKHNDTIIFRTHDNQFRKHTYPKPQIHPDFPILQKSIEESLSNTNIAE